ncbi:MAG: 6-bladed beta-propeller [Pseudomonadota bacterium]
MLKKISAALLVLLMTAGEASADILVRYAPDLTDEQPTNCFDPFLPTCLFDSTPMPTDVVDPGLSASMLQQNMPNAFANRAPFWPVFADQPFNADEYLTFTLTPGPLNVLNFESLSYSAGSFSIASGLFVRLRTSLDGFSSDVDVQPIPDDATTPFDLLFDLTSLPPDIASSVEIRLYPDNTVDDFEFMDLVGLGAGGTGVTVNGTAKPPLAYERMLPQLKRPWYFNNSGISTDTRGFLYFTDILSFDVQKYAADGALVQRFGGEGSGPGQFRSLSDVSLDSDENLYVLDNSRQKLVKFDPDGNLLMEILGISGNPVAVDLDSEGNIYVLRSSEFQVTKYNPEGTELFSWGSEGAGIGEFGADQPGFNGPFGLAVDQVRGEVFVVDTFNQRIQVFDLEGNFRRLFVDGGQSPFPLTRALAAHIDGRSGLLLVVEDAFGVIKTYDPGTGGLVREFRVDTGQVADVATLADSSVVISGFATNRIELRGSDGVLRYSFGSAGRGPGQFRIPVDVAVDAFGNSYVTDEQNRRIQVFNSQGVLRRQLDSVSDAGSFNPRGLAIGPSGDLWVTDSAQNDLVRLSTTGDLISRCDSPAGIGSPIDVAVDAGGTVYVLDDASGAPSVAVFSNSCVHQTTWTSIVGASDGFKRVGAIAAGNGSVYITDRGTDFAGTAFDGRIMRVSPAGVIQQEVFDPLFNGDRMDLVQGLTVAADGRVFASDLFRDRVLIFDPDLNPFIAVGQRGHYPGSLYLPVGLAITGDNRLHVAEAGNDRLQILAPPGLPSQDRAIVVTGGGPYPGNALWEATQANANFAVRVLSFSGYTKDRIQYLSADQSLDLDQNGLADDVDGDATVAELAAALRGDFVEDIDSLLVYLVDHGGDQTFRMSGTELLASGELDALLDEFQAANPGVPLTVIYDACQSGSFIAPLASPGRTVITSAMGSQNAYFVSQGSLSFSNGFWGQILSGETVGVAFESASTLVSESFQDQTPQVDANANGVANEQADLDAVAGQIIGSDILLAGEAPSIQALSGAQIIDSGSSATLSATVLDPDGVQRVFAILRPPGFIPASPDNPIEGLPQLEFVAVGGDEFTVTADIFNVPGTYNIAVYASDSFGNTSNATLTSVTVDNPLRRKAIILAGAAGPGLLGTAGRVNSELAYRALLQQGYGPDGESCLDDSCDSLRFLTFAGSSGRDGNPSLAALQDAIENFGTENAQDLILYLIAPEEGGSLVLSGVDTLSPSALDSFLDTAQETLPGEITVVIDADNAGSFASALVPPVDKRRSVIVSTAAGQAATFQQNGQISFSRFFWNQVLNGARLRSAFLVARSALRYRSNSQTPGLDDNGNGIVNEFIDGFRSRLFSLGNGILLAGDDPLIGEITLPATLTAVATPLSVAQVTTTGTVAEVVALVTRPSGEEVSVNLSGSGSDWAISTEALCAGAGTYEVGVFAVDDEGATSAPVTASASRASACEGPVDLLAQDGSVDTGISRNGRVTLSLTVRNDGGQDAAATEVVFRLSPDAAIDEADAELIRVPIGPILAGEELPLSQDIQLPGNGFTGFIGACVQAVSGESVYSNNCLSGQAVLVELEEAVFADGFEL